MHREFKKISEALQYLMNWAVQEGMEKNVEEQILNSF